MEKEKINAEEMKKLALKSEIDNVLEMILVASRQGCLNTTLTISRNHYGKTSEVLKDRGFKIAIVQEYRNTINIFISW